MSSWWRYSKTNKTQTLPSRSQWSRKGQACKMLNVKNCYTSVRSVHTGYHGIKRRKYPVPLWSGCGLREASEEVCSRVVVFPKQGAQSTKAWWCEMAWVGRNGEFSRAVAGQWGDTVQRCLDVFSATIGSTDIADQVVAKFLKLASMGINLDFMLLAFRKGLTYHLISSTIYLVPRDVQGKPAFKIYYRILFTLKFQSFDIVSLR